MNHELTIPEPVIGAAATILRQYVPEITPSFLKAAILQYHYSGDSTEKKGGHPTEIDPQGMLPDPRHLHEHAGALHSVGVSEDYQAGAAAGPGRSGKRPEPA